MNKKEGISVSISAGTRDLIKNMMKTAKLSYRQQQKLDEHLLQGRMPDPTAMDLKNKADKPPKKVTPTVRHKLTRHLRTFDQIMTSGVYEIDDPWKPLPSKNYETEKLKLITRMSGEDEEQPRNKKKLAKAEDEAHIDEFEMLLTEIAERKEFLDSLADIGQDSDFHRQKIHTEISQRVGRLEKLQSQQINQ